MTTEEETRRRKICHDMDSFEYSLCQIPFNDRSALYRHRRREHVLETNVTLGECELKIVYWKQQDFTCVIYIRYYTRSTLDWPF
jgi:hypothetical protein